MRWIGLKSANKKDFVFFSFGFSFSFLTYWYLACFFFLILYFYGVLLFRFVFNFFLRFGGFFFEREWQKKRGYIQLIGYSNEEDLGGVEKGKNMIKIHCIKINKKETATTKIKHHLQWTMSDNCLGPSLITLYFPYPGYTDFFTDYSRHASISGPLFWKICLP